MPVNDHAELAVFIAVAEERSFKRAATRLMLTPSTLSHSLRSLEDRLGVRLLNRTTRTVSLTEAGGALLEEVAPAFRAVAIALERVNAFRGTPRGTVRINVPRLAATLLIQPRIAAFCDAYPDVRLEVVVSDDLEDIVMRGFDAGIRVGENVDRDMAAIPLGGDLRGAVVGSPGYFRRHPKPKTPRDLERHRCINRRHAGSGVLHRWEFAKGSQRLSVLEAGPLVLNSDEMMIQAAREGLGLAFVSDSDVVDDLSEKRLVRVLDDWCPSLGRFFLYHPRNRNMSASLEALITTLSGDEQKTARRHEV